MSAAQLDTIRSMFAIADILQPTHCELCREGHAAQLDSIREYVRRIMAE